MAPPAPALFDRKTLRSTRAAPLANSDRPPPHPSSWLVSIVFPISWTVPAPAIETPPPPMPPEQLAWRLSRMTLLRIVAAENEAWIAPASQYVLPVTMLPSMSAGPPDTSIAPLSTLLPPPPLRIVNPRSVGVSPASVAIFTTTPRLQPSIVVAAAPPELWTVMFLWAKSIRSPYVPGATTTTSPSAAASIAAWIVG